MGTLKTLQEKYGAHRLYLVRDFPEEIAGAQKLKRFTGELWQIQEKTSSSGCALSLWHLTHPGREGR